MPFPTVKTRFSGWLRNLGWLAFILLGLVLVLVTAWRVMENSHQKARALARSERKVAKNSPPTPAVASAREQSASTGGFPLAELPLIGIYTGDDAAARKDLEKQLEEIMILMNSNSRVDGVLSFRKLLAKLGMVVPETMTEVEAAAKFLKWAERFSELLSQWREAVTKGPWDLGITGTKESGANGNKIFRIAYQLHYLLATLVEASLRTGDASTAYSDLQTMEYSANRCGDMPGTYKINLSWQILNTAHAGMELGGWTDDQLMGISTMLSGESALASVRQTMEYRKTWITDYLTQFRDHQNEIQEDFSHSESPIDRMINRFGVATATDQQMADNLAVIHFQMDQLFTRFDATTGVYLGESTGDIRELPHSKPSDVSFDKFYYMYSERYGGDYDLEAKWIIQYQSAIDETRIAAALEIGHRATGEYPEQLDAVSGAFGGSPPIDIATGRPYFYQRDAGGGYTLWGTGIDGRSDGGNEQSDVTWKHRPVTGK